MMKFCYMCLDLVSIRDNSHDGISPPYTQFHEENRHPESKQMIQQHLLRRNRKQQHHVMTNIL